MDIQRARRHDVDEEAIVSPQLALVVRTYVLSARAASSQLAGAGDDGGVAQVRWTNRIIKLLDLSGAHSSRLTGGRSQMPCTVHFIFCFKGRSTVEYDVTRFFFFGECYMMFFDRLLDQKGVRVLNLILTKMSLTFSLVKMIERGGQSNKAI